MSALRPKDVVFFGPPDGPRARLFLSRVAGGPSNGARPLVAGRADGPAQLQKFARANAWVIADGAEVPEPIGGVAPGFVQLLECGADWRRVQLLQSAGAQIAGVAPVLAPAVARYAVGMALLAQQQHVTLSQATRRDVLAAGRSRRAFASFSGKTVGIVGLGRVGEEVARLLAGADAELQYADRRTAPHGLAGELGLRRVTLDRLLVTSDVITVHAPWGPTADPLLGARELGLIGRETVLAITSDWRVLDLMAAAVSLQHGALRSLALDAALPEDGEVAEAGRTLRALPKAVVTPASATSSRQDHSDAVDFALANVRDVLGGGVPSGLIDVIDFPKAGDPAFWSSRMYPRARDAAS